MKLCFFLLILSFKVITWLFQYLVYIFYNYSKYFFCQVKQLYALRNIFLVFLLYMIFSYIWYFSYILNLHSSFSPFTFFKTVHNIQNTIEMNDSQFSPEVYFCSTFPSFALPLWRLPSHDLRYLILLSRHRRLLSANLASFLKSPVTWELNG